MKQTPKDRLRRQWEALMAFYGVAAAQAETAFADGHDIPRRTSITDGDARAYLRHVAHRQLCIASFEQSVQSGNVGRGDV